MMEPTESMESAAAPSLSFGRRLVGAALFDIAVYEDVEHDTAATWQAAGVVGLVAIATAVSGLQGGLGGSVAGVVGAYLGWALWSGTCYLVGTQLFEGTADWGELLRTIGFAQAPGILFALGLLPALGVFVQVAVFLWMIGTALVAIRQALDFSTMRALATALAGFVPYVLVRSLVEILLGIQPSVLPRI